jgi:hypothetical protein
MAYSPTNSMELSPSQRFMELKGSSPCSQELLTVSWNNTRNKKNDYITLEVEYIVAW